jgi:glycerol uptake facilitator protein
MSADMPRRLLAEAIGTGILVTFGAGSVVAALTFGGGELDYAGLGMVAITFGLAIALAIYACGNTSGAHLNPAAAFAFDAVARPRLFELEAAPGTPGVIEGQRDEPMEAPAATTTRERRGNG